MVLHKGADENVYAALGREPPKAHYPIASASLAETGSTVPHSIRLAALTTRRKPDDLIGNSGSFLPCPSKSQISRLEFALLLDKSALGNLHELCEGGRSLGWLSERATTCEQAVSHQAFQARRPGYDLSGVLRGTLFAGLLSL